MSIEQLAAPAVQVISPFSEGVIGGFQPPPVVISRVRTERGLRTLARNAWGCDYVPRNQTLIVPRQQLEDPKHRAYNDYLRRPTVRDGFGSEHNARRRWQSKQSKQIDTQLFDKDFVNNNQITGNAIASVILQTEILADIVYSGIRGLSDTLKLIAEAMYQMYASGVLYTEDAQERYRNLSFEQKLSVVHELTKLIGCALWEIAYSTDPNPKAVKIRTTGNFNRSRLPSQSIALLA